MFEKCSVYWSVQLLKKELQPQVNHWIQQVSWSVSKSVDGLAKVFRGRSSCYRLSVRNLRGIQSKRIQNFPSSPWSRDCWQVFPAFHTRSHLLQNFKLNKRFTNNWWITVLGSFIISISQTFSGTFPRYWNRTYRPCMERPFCRPVVWTQSQIKMSLATSDTWHWFSSNNIWLSFTSPDASA